MLRVAPYRCEGVGAARAHTPGSEMAITAASRGRFRHLALFYHSGGEYLSALCGFIRASRARGEAVLVAVPEQQAERVRQGLGDESAEVAIIDMAELGRNPARIIPEVLTYASKHRGQRLSFIGERREFGIYYHRAVAMEVVDGEMEILRAGEWRAFQEGAQSYSVNNPSATNLPPGRFVLTRQDRHLRLQWLLAGKNKGGIVTRETDMP